MGSKKSSQDFPYKTLLNILRSPLEVIDVQKLADACKDKWYNQTLCQVNDSVVRLGVLEGEYHWHEHNDIDEFFFVLDGHFLIDLEDKVVDLGPRQVLLFQKGFDIARARRNAPSFLWSNERISFLQAIEKSEPDWRYTECKSRKIAGDISTTTVTSTS